MQGALIIKVKVCTKQNLMVFLNKVLELRIFNSLWCNKRRCQKWICLFNSNIPKFPISRIYKESIVIGLYLIILNKIDVISVSGPLKLELGVKCIICNNWSFFRLIFFSKWLIFFQVIKWKVHQTKKFIYLLVLFALKATGILVVLVTFFNFNWKGDSIIESMSILDHPMIS